MYTYIYIYIYRANPAFSLSTSCRVASSRLAITYSCRVCVKR